MKSRKILLFLFMSVFAISAFAQNKLINKSIYEVPKTTVEPVIDGIPDPVWLTVDWVFQGSYTNNGTGWDGTWTDLFGASKMMYDDNNLYILVYTQDDDPVGNDAASVNWQRNAVEIYLDGDNTKDNSGTVVAPDHHLTFRHEHIGDEANSDWDVETGLDSTDLVWKLLDDPTTMTGYWLEVKVPLDAVNMSNIPGTPIGVEFQQDDNDGTGRDAVSKWFAPAGDSAWQYASTWGTGVMSSRVVGNEFEINKTAAVPVIDGDFDDLWQNANSLSTNYFGNISTTAPVYPDNFADAFVRAYFLYDDNNLYGFIHVLDDDPVGNDAASVNWQRNAVEVYLDGDNSKDNSGTVAAPDHHLTFRHEHIGDEVNSDWDVETGLDSTDLVWIIKDIPSVEGVADASGYNVEFKVPLDAINLPNVAGSPIGLEFQQDDNDGNGRDVVTKWFEALGDSSWQYASTWGNAKLGSPVATDVKNNAPVVTSYSLLQNYPNPFNPTTNIVYSVPQTQKVKLTVYNILGKQVSTLVNEVKNAGTYTVHFNANNLSSGVYIYKLEAGSKLLVNKMMFLK